MLTHCYTYTHTHTEPNVACENATDVCVIKGSDESEAPEMLQVVWEMFHSVWNTSRLFETQLPLPSLVTSFVL